MGGAAAELAILIKARDTASKTIGKIGKAMQGLKKIATVAALAAAAALAAFAVSAVKAASDLEEAVNKSNEVFGASVQLVREFAETSADSFGLSKRAANEYAGTLGIILTGSGLAQDAAAGMSIDLLKLAADMASFNNIPIDVALEKLRAGLVGETEPLRTVGVLLNENAVKTEAYAAGIAAQGAVLTDAQKVQARYNIILEQTAVQQGDFARTSESASNATRRASATFEDLRAMIGERLLPIWERLINAVADNMPAAFEKIDRVVAEVLPVIQAFISLWMKGVRWIIDHKPALVAAIVAVGVAFAFLFPLQILIVAVIGVIGLFAAENGKLGKSALQLKVKILEVVSSIVNAIAVVTNIIGKLPGMGKVAEGVAFAQDFLRRQTDGARGALANLELEAARNNFGALIAAQATGAEIKLRDLEAAFIDTFRAAVAAFDVMAAAEAGLQFGIAKGRLEGTIPLPVLPRATNPPAAVLPPASLGGGGGSMDTAPTVRERWEAAGAAIASAIGRGLITGRLSIDQAISKVMDALQKTPAEFRDTMAAALQEIADAQARLDVLQETWNAALERGKVIAQDILDLLAAGQFTAAQDFIDEFRGRSSEIGAAIFEKTQEEAAKAAMEAAAEFQQAFEQQLSDLESEIGATAGRIFDLLGTETREMAFERLELLRLELELMKEQGRVAEDVGRVREAFAKSILQIEESIAARQETIANLSNEIDGLQGQAERAAKILGQAVAGVAVPARTLVELASELARARAAGGDRRELLKLEREFAKLERANLQQRRNAESQRERENILLEREQQQLGQTIVLRDRQIEQLTAHQTLLEAQIAAIEAQNAIREKEAEILELWLQLSLDLIPTRDEVNAQLEAELLALEQLRDIQAEVIGGVFNVISAMALFRLGLDDLAQSILTINAGLQPAPGEGGSAAGATTNYILGTVNVTTDNPDVLANLQAHLR